MTLRIAVDARPLALPMVGITRYTFELLWRLVTDSSHQWFLYLDRPVIHPLPDLPNVHIREGNCRRSSTSSVFAQWFSPAGPSRIESIFSGLHAITYLYC